jgi:hypothetical protein
MDQWCGRSLYGTFCAVWIEAGGCSARLFSATVESRDKQDVVARLDLVGLLALELPIGVVDEDQDARAACLTQTTQLAGIHKGKVRTLTP